MNLMIVNALKDCKQSSIKLSVINQLVQGLNKSQQTQEKYLSKLLNVSLAYKKSHKDFDVSQVLGAIFAKVFEKSHKHFIEFNIKVALESTNENKQSLAIIALQQLTYTYSLPPQIMVIVALTLLQSNSSIVREQTLNLLEIYNQIKEDAQQIVIFTDTNKPKSAKKVLDRQEFTPIKIKPIQKLLKSITALKSEIIADKQQLSIAVNSSTAINNVDSAARFLLDLPTIKIKKAFVGSLRVLTKFNIVFAMALQEQLNKEYFQLKQSKVTEADYEYISAIGSLIEKMCIPTSNDAHEEFISSLAFPFLNFGFHILSSEQGSQFLKLEEQIARIMKSDLFTFEVMKLLKQEHKTQVLKYYIQSQIQFQSKLYKREVQEALITLFGGDNEEKRLTLSDKDVLPIINDLKEKLFKQNDLSRPSVNQLEVLLEVLTQVKVSNDVTLLQPMLDIIQILSKLSLEDPTLFYLIELCSQQCISIMYQPNKAN